MFERLTPWRRRDKAQQPEDPSSMDAPEQTTSDPEESDALAPRARSAAALSDSEVLAEHRRTTSEISRLSRELEEAKASLAAMAEEDSIDDHDDDVVVDRFVAARTQTTRLEIRLEMLRRRRTRLGDALHSVRVNARLKEQSIRQAGILELSRELETIAREKTQHNKAIKALEASVGKVRMRMKALERQVEEVSVSADRKVGAIDSTKMSPDSPPPGVLVKPSRWRAFVEAVRSKGREGMLWIEVDEHSGEIRRSSLQE